VSAFSVRTPLLLLGAALASSVGHGRPAPPDATPVTGVRPYYTAFPDIKPARLHTVVKDADGTERVAVERTDAVSLPKLPAVAADAPLLRKVQLAQIREGLDYVDRIKENARLGAQHPSDVQAVAVEAEVCLIAAELEETPAKRVPWFEARVRVLKEGEETIYAYVLQGVVPVTALHLARFERLRAEADLLRLKAEVEKPKK
jgi:hypothetical protein